jgi:hypothetical protein
MVKELVTREVHALLEHQTDMLKHDMRSGFDQLTGKVELMGNKIESSRLLRVDAREAPCVDLREPESEGSPSKFASIDNVRGAGAPRCDLFDLFKYDVETCEEDYVEEDCEIYGEKEDFVDENITCSVILLPIEGSWFRMASAELARSRLRHLRDLNAAPASARAMVGRTDGHSSSEEDDEASIVNTVPFSHPDNVKVKVDVEAVSGEEQAEPLHKSDVDALEPGGQEDGADEVLDAFLEALCDMASTTGKRDVAATHAKRAFSVFVRARVAHGADREVAITEGKLILQGLVEWKRQS